MPDAVQLIDIDLSILGQPWSIYEEYARGVKAEYCPAVVSEFRFRVGRRAFLKSLLRQPQVFLTEEIAALLERTAQVNIRKEISLLESEAGMVERVLMRIPFRK